MKKILIVDDEVLVRVGFRSIIDWEACDFCVVGEAENGEEALEKIRMHQPDLVFTDLMMDGMDGFELMRRCAETYPHIQFVVLSSYNDFENVRKAMRLGALDYVFKLDVKPEQLRKMLMEIQWDASHEAKATSHKDERAMRSSLVSRAIVADTPEPQLMEGFSVLFPQMVWERPFALITILIDNYGLLYQTPREKLSQSGIRDVETVLLGVLKGRVTLCPFRTDRTLLVWQEEGVEALRALQAIYAKAAIYIKRYVNLSVTAVMSETFPTLSRLPEAHGQNEETLSYRYLLDHGRIHSYHAVKNEDSAPPYESIPKLEEALGNQDFRGAEDCLLALFGRLFKRRGCPLQKLRVFLLDVFFALKRQCPQVASWQNSDSHSLEEIIQRSDRLGEVRDAMCQALRDALEESAGDVSPVRDEIQTIIQYVRAHITEEMTVAKAARRVRMSESYFAHIFKREVNSSFIDWLNRERVTRAQKLLCQTNKRVNEIASEVGIDNANYFSILFKKITGKTPLEMREERKSSIEIQKTDL